MSDTYTEVSHTSWFSRIAGALVGMLFGIVLFIVAFPLLFWNEGRAVDRIKALDEGASSVVTISADQVLAENQNKLVHLSAKTATEEVLADQVFGVSSNAIKFKRDVKIYQWKEESSTKKRKKLGGGEETVTEYTYSKTWDDELINSNQFKKTDYKNPSSVPYNKTRQQANDVSMGAFKLPQSLISKINNYQQIEITDAANLKLGSDIKASVYQGGYYLGNNPDAPEVGDLIVTFSHALPSKVSVVAEQLNDTFQEYSTSSGGSLLLLQNGEVSAQAMFEKAKADNTILTWLIRAGGFLLMFAGLSMLLRPISVLADVVPLFGNIAEAGIAVVAFLIALLLSVITIAIAWIIFRPIIGGALLVTSTAVVWVLVKKIKAAKKASQNADPNGLPELAG